MAFNYTPPGKNNPQDTRNMIIFGVVAILLWLAYDHFVGKPNQQALRAVQHAEATMTPEQKLAREERLKAELPVPREDVLSKGERLPFGNENVAGSFSTTGNRFDDLSFRQYMTELHGSKPVTLFSPAGTEHAHYAEIGWLSEDTEIKVPGRNTVWTVKDKGAFTAEKPALLTWDNGQGLVFERRMSIDSNYLITVKQTVRNNTKQAVTVYPYASVARRGFPTHEKGPGYEGPLGFIDGEMEEISYGDVAEEPAFSKASKGGWIGFGEKYWLSAIIPDQKGSQTYRFSSKPNEGKLNLLKTLYQADVRNDAIIIPAGDSADNITYLFGGAKKVNLLEQYEDQLNIPHFDLAVDFGVLYFLTRPLYFFLTLFNSWVGNFGIAILMLTLLVRAAVFPLASASYRSFAKLRKVAPKMAELKVKYGDDKPRMQQELVKLYETEKVNPMAGCFPLLLQIPIFFAVYKVISISIEMRHAPFFGWIHDLSVHDPLSIFNGFGMIPWDPPTLLMVGPWSIAMLILMLLQKQLNPPPQDQIQKDIANFMPWVITFVLSSFPSGLVIYWTFSNLISVIQQSYIMKSMGVPVYLFSPDKAIEHHNTHANNLQEATERAKAEKEAKNAKKIEGTDVTDVKQVTEVKEVKESLFGDDTDKKDGK